MYYENCNYYMLFVIMSQRQKISICIIIYHISLYPLVLIITLHFILLHYTTLVVLSGFGLP